MYLCVASRNVCDLSALVSFFYSVSKVRISEFGVRLSSRRPTMAATYPIVFPLSKPIHSEEEWYDLRGTNVSQFFLKHWFPTDQAQNVVKPKAAIIFVHGFADYINRYDGNFSYMADHGYQVSGFDQFGFGRTWYESPDRRTTHGWTTWPEQINDITSMIKLVRVRLDKDWGAGSVPMYLMGHSMGGGLVTAFFTRDTAEGPAAEVKGMISGVMASAPWYDIHFPIPTWLAGPLLRGALWGLPRLHLALGPPSWNLSRDSELCEALRKDPLSNCDVHVRCLLGPLTGGPRIVSDDYKRWPESLPFLICHGTGDKVTRWDSSKALFDNMSAIGRHVTLRSFDGYYHEAMFDPGDAKFKFTQAFVEYVFELGGD